MGREVKEGEVPVGAVRVAVEVVRVVVVVVVVVEEVEEGGGGREGERGVERCKVVIVVLSCFTER